MRKFIFPFLFLLICCFQLYAQKNPMSALKFYNDNYPHEKVYLWFNKTAYIAGETIQFKAYIFSSYELVNFSTSLYVELYDAERKIINTKLLPIQYGSTQGSIELDSKLSEGVYYIRAYTRWMLNFDESFQFIKSIPVYNSTSKKQLTLINSPWKVQAFPEGGNLIDSLNSKVAVRLYSPTSLPEKWRGYIFEDTNPALKIEEFSSIDKNVAIFSFIPEARKNYFVSVQDENGNSQTSALPAVKNSGIAFSIEEATDSITYKIRTQNLSDKNNEYSILGNIQQQLVYFAKFKPNFIEISNKIPVASIANGIVQFTIFDPENEPIAERLVFLNHGKLNFDSAVVDNFNPDNSPRINNELTLVVDSINWNSYAVSVTDGDNLSSLIEENLLSSLFLTSDIRNPIQQAGNYFIKPDKNKIEALDAILISEKWNRFSWNEILQNKYPALPYFPHNFLSYTGVVKKGNKLKPLEEVNLILSFPDSTHQIFTSKTDSTGSLVINNLAFTGELKVFYQLNSKKSNSKYIDIEFERNNRFTIYSLPFPESPYILSANSEGTTRPEWISRAVKTLQSEQLIDERYKSLQEVVIRANLKTAKEMLNEKLSSGAFRSSNETVFDFVNEQQNAIGYTNILSWLQGRVAGLSIQMNSSGFLVPFLRGDPVGIVVDEMQMEPDFLNLLSVNDIAMVKVLKGFVPGLPMGGGGGAIAIYTMRGGLRSAFSSSSLPSNKIIGYDIVKNSYAPQYNDKSAFHPEKDTRDQLLWETLLVPKVANDKSRISFFNNDNTKRFRITVQGFTDSGVPVFFEKIIEPVPKSF